MSLAEQIAELSNAEDFLALFKIDYDPAVIAHKRIQLLRLFHQNLQVSKTEPDFTDYQQALAKAYCLLQRGEQVALDVPKCATCSECH